MKASPDKCSTLRVLFRGKTSAKASNPSLPGLVPDRFYKKAKEYLVSSLLNVSPETVRTETSSWYAVRETELMKLVSRLYLKTHP